MATPTPTSVRKIPLDVVIEILLLLPVESLVRFKSVCKCWRNLINSTFFLQLHLNNTSNSRYNRLLFYILDFSLFILDHLYHSSSKFTQYHLPKSIISDDRAKLETVGSSNGLLCLSLVSFHWTIRDRVRTRFLVCNPSTRSLKSINPPAGKKWTVSSDAFGYDTENDDYKIVVYCKGSKPSNRDVGIYSLKAGLWRFHTESESGQTDNLDLGCGVFGNNMLHYIVPRKSHDHYFTIARFHLSSEKWIDDLSFPVPEALRGRSIKHGVFEGCMYLRHAGSRDDSTEHVWMMGECGVWSKMYRLASNFSKYDLIARSKDAPPRLLLQHSKGDRELIWYNPQDNTRIPFQVRELPKVPWDKSTVTVKLLTASLVHIPGSCLYLSKNKNKMQQIKD